LLQPSAPLFVCERRRSQRRAVELTINLDQLSESGCERRDVNWLSLNLVNDGIS